MANIYGAIANGVGGDPAHANDEAGSQDVDESTRVDEPGIDLGPGRPPVGEGMAYEEGVGGHRVPEDDAPLGPHLFEYAVHDGPGWFLPWSGPEARSSVRVAPAQQIELAREGDARPAHPLVAGGLAHGEHVCFVAFLEVLPQVGEPNRWPIGQIVGTDFAELVEGRADSCLAKVRQQGVDRG